MKAFYRASSLLGLLLCVSSVTGNVQAATLGGTVISNTVSATYVDGNGGSYTTVSNTISTTVTAVPSVTVSPAETGCNAATDGYIVGSPVTKTFTVTNTSNINDSYTLTASTSAGAITSVATVTGGVTTPFPNGSTAAAIAPGATLQVQVTISTTGIAVGASAEISLQATSTAPTTAGAAPATFTASQCAIAAAKASIAGPTGPTSQVTKLIDGKTFESVTPGQAVTYSIAFENYGGVAATNVVLTDVFPAGVVPSLSSVQLNGVSVLGTATLNGQTLTVGVGTLQPGTVYTLTVAAAVATSLPLGTSIVNTATLASANATPVTSSPASGLVGTANVVYDGYAGATLPIPGATVSLVSSSNTQVPLPAGLGLAPNTANSDPFVTGTGGVYTFGLGPTQIGPVTYTIVITAPGYVSRRIQVTLTPSTLGSLYSVTLTALDGLPLAVPGGYALTSAPVTIPALYGVFGNLPMFRTQSIQITKTVDRSIASGGDRLVYTLAFSNVITPLGAATVVDTLPRGIAYAPGTALVDGVHEEPVISGNTLTWKFSTLVTNHTIVYATVIIPGVSQGTTLHNVATVSAAPPNAPTSLVSASASVDTQVIGGLFSDQTIITGRVFVDLTQDGYFHKGDTGIPNVRIYLEDGESVITDSNGRYSFPGVRPGMHVLRLDATTLPTGTKPFGEHDYDSPQSIRRLVHGVFDGGIIEDVNFAIEAVQ
jgi:uncharacterized repeat protein (TIGR01451 family)